MIPVPGSEFLGWKGHQPAIVPLDQEASVRRYFRLEYPGETMVLCQDASLNNHFVELAAFYAAHGLPVPEVIRIDHDNHAMLQSFCGDRDLSSVTDDLSYAAYLRKAIDIIVSLQKLQPLPVVAGRRFDYNKLKFELDFTSKHLFLFAEKSGDHFLMPQHVYAYMDELAARLAENREFVVCHRDFHSRNLLLKPDGSLCMIDFQDSMMGLRGYDLASLLFDAYRPVTDAMRKEALAYYLRESGIEAGQFLEEFYLIAMQRSFKAFGSYLMLVGERKMEKFRPSLKNCLQHMNLISSEEYFPAMLPDYFCNLANIFKEGTG